MSPPSRQSAGPVGRFLSLFDIRVDNRLFLVNRCLNGQRGTPMSRVLACLVALLLVPSFTSARQIVGSQLQAGPSSQPPRNGQPVTGRSALRGRVVAADS